MSPGFFNHQQRLNLLNINGAEWNRQEANVLWIAGRVSIGNSLITYVTL